MQLHTAHLLFAAASLLSVVAFALVDLREHSRRQPDARPRPPGYLRSIYKCYAANSGGCYAPLAKCTTRWLDSAVI